MVIVALGNNKTRRKTKQFLVEEIMKSLLRVVFEKRLGRADKVIGENVAGRRNKNRSPKEGACLSQGVAGDAVSEKRYVCVYQDSVRP